MQRSLILIFVVFLAFVLTIQAQKKRTSPVKKDAAGSQRTEKTPNVAIVVNERLAVLRIQPSLYSDSLQRVRTGRILAISGATEADGVTFYRVSVSPRKYGWLQAEALVGKNRHGDDERLARLVQASEGFEQIETGVIYLRNFPKSPLRPSILLLLGDLAEELALKLSRDATRQIDKREMTASGAPLHSYYLNYVRLDRYRKLGINFWFNSATKSFHYNGATWNEILAKFPRGNEAEEAKKRLATLKEKMAQIN